MGLMLKMSTFSLGFIICTMLNDIDMYLDGSDFTSDQIVTFQSNWLCRINPQCKVLIADKWSLDIGPNDGK